MKTIRNVALMLALAAGATSLAQAQTPAQAQPAASYHGQSLTRARKCAPTWPCGSAPAWSASGAARPRPISTAVNTGSPMPVCAPAQRPQYQAEVQRQGGRADRRGGRRGLRHARAPPQSSYSLHLADLELDLLRGRAIRNREVLRLTPRNSPCWPS